MAKYVMLSSDRSHRWELPPETDMEALRSKLLQAWAGGTPVPYIHVVVEAQQVPLHIHGGALPMFALVDVPDPESVLDSFL